MIQVVTILYRSRALIPPSSLPFLRLSVEGLFEIVSTPSFLSRRFRSFLFLIPTPLQSGPFSSPPNPSPVMAFRSRTLSKEEILRLRSEHLPPNLTLHYRSSQKGSLHIVRGEGQYLIDVNGEKYLDCVNNVASVGHSHPQLVDAVCRQMELINTNTRYMSQTIAEYAERLTQLFPDPLKVVFFVNSGSEANDLALRLAKTYTRRNHVIAVEGAYHGHLSSLVDISSYKYNGAGGQGRPPQTLELPCPDPYRGVFRGNTEETGIRYANLMLPLLQRPQQEEETENEDGGSGGGDGGKPAAFIVESILGCAGQIVPPPGFMKRAFQIARSAGALCISDEVQCGFGRIGAPYFWGFQLHGVIPDIVTLAKPIGNGFPLGAVVTTKAIAQRFQDMEWFATCGGANVSMATGLAVLNIMQAENLSQNAAVVGKYLLQRLQQLQEHSPVLGDVRGIGLFLGLEFVHSKRSLEPAAEIAKFITDRLRDRHQILVSTDGLLGNVIKIKPPLVFTQDNADTLTASLQECLETWESTEASRAREQPKQSRL